MKFKTGMKILFIFLFVMLFSTIGVATPLLIVRDVPGKVGDTRIEIFFPDENRYIPITKSYSGISFPIFCEKTGLIGFTNFTDEGKYEVYLILPGKKEPKKRLDKAILQDISSDGKFILVTNKATIPSLYLVDLEDETVQRLTEKRTITSACFSTDDKSVVYSVADESGTQDLYQLFLKDLNDTRLTKTSNCSEFFPLFTSDARTLLFMTDRSGNWGVDFLKLENMKRFESKIWGQFPKLSFDNSFFAYEKDGAVFISNTDGEVQYNYISGRNPEWITVERSKDFLAKDQTSSDLHDCWIKRSEDYSYKLGEFLDPKIGTGPTASWEQNFFFYYVDMKNNWAKTNVKYSPSSKNSPEWLDQGGQALFMYSWTTLPQTLKPGEILKFTLTAEDDGSYGKASSGLLGNLEWSYGFEDREQEMMYTREQWENIEAGGSFLTSEWQQKTVYSFDWIVPWPEQGGFNPERFPLTVKIALRSTAASTAEGYYTCTYEYIP
jgi:hypothetical protein